MEKPFHRLGITELKNKLKLASNEEDKLKIMNKIKSIQDKNRKKKTQVNTNDPKRNEFVQKYLEKEREDDSEKHVSFSKASTLLKEYVSAKGLMERMDRQDVCIDIPSNFEVKYPPPEKKGLLQLLELEGYDILTITLQLCPK